jgi:5-bromo-4-chloroindolyl phosphate hydrolysis protein
MFEMKSESSKYERITEILKKSGPVLTESEAIEKNVMARIEKMEKKVENYNILDHLFGWVYIGWVRKGLIVVSFVIIAFFAVQQSIILKRINNLERQTISISPSFVRGVPDDFESTLMIYKQSGKISLKGGMLSDKQLKQLEKSIEDLQASYRNLIKLIEDNPELKQYIENKLSENEKKKINL